MGAAWSGGGGFGGDGTKALPSGGRATGEVSAASLADGAVPTGGDCCCDCCCRAALSGDGGDVGPAGFGVAVIEAGSLERSTARAEGAAGAGVAAGSGTAAAGGRGTDGAAGDGDGDGDGEQEAGEDLSAGFTAFDTDNVDDDDDGSDEAGAAVGF